MGFIGEAFTGAGPLPPPSELERKLQSLLVQRSDLELAVKGLLAAVGNHSAIHRPTPTSDECDVCQAVLAAEQVLRGVKDV